MAPRPFVPLSDGAQVIIRLGFGFGIITNRLWFQRLSGSVTPTTLQELVDGVQQWYYANMLRNLSNDVVLTNCQAIDWTVQFGTVIASAGPTGLGGEVSPSLSANVAVKVRLTGAQPPRNFHNYQYIGGIPENGVNGNTLDVFFAQNVRDAYITLIDLPAFFGTFPAWRWVVTSQAVDNAPRTSQFSARMDFVSVSPVTHQRRIRLLHT
jgi:hypothetical protein